jgi:N-acetylneuraminic acid mutarotase
MMPLLPEARWLRRSLVLLLLAGALGFGFLAGLRYPFTFLDRWIARWKPPAGWTRLAAGALPRYEAGVAVADGRLFVFGGFYNVQIQATPRVDVYDPATNTWRRLHDMPAKATHRIPVVVGGSMWFAGGFIGDNPGPATAEVWRYDIATDSWHPGPPLPVKRAGGVFALLDGALHYAGGYEEDRDTNSGDHWSLSLDAAERGGAAWKPLAPMPEPRGHMAGVVLDGFLYVVGGALHHDPISLDIDRVDRYDPRTDTWSEVTHLPIPRSHTEPGTFVDGGRLVVVGGRSRPNGIESVPDVTIYDPAEDRWVALPPLPEPMLAPVAAEIGDRLITGYGGSVGDHPSATAFWSTPLGEHWERWKPMPVALGEVAAGIVGDRLFLIGDGSSATLAFDLARGLWEAPGARALRPYAGNHHAAEVVAGKLYVLGGLGSGEGKLQIYDPARDTWSLGPDLPFAAGSSASAAIGGAIYLAGGIVAGRTTGRAARFDPVAGTWSPIAPMPKPRNHAAAATDGRRLFVFGGRGPGSGDSNVVANGYADVQIYDPAADRWIASGDGLGAPALLPQGRGGTGKAVFLDGEFYVLGGETLDGPGATGDRVYTRVDIYDPVANRWRAGPPMPTGRHGIFPLAVAHRIYVAGGGTRAGYGQSDVMEVLALRRPAP